MLFSDNARYSYAVSPLIEVICQLRFPTILSIGSTEPAQFQEMVRGEFPKYVARQEQQPLKITNPNSAQPQVERQAPITNYNFISADGLWKINLTKDFIALSTLRYTSWEEFAAGYVIGRAMWSGSGMSLMGIISIAQGLLEDEESPW